MSENKYYAFNIIGIFKRYIVRELGNHSRNKSDLDLWER